MFNIALIREDLTVKGGEERIASTLSSELSEKYNVHLINLYKNNVAYGISKNVIYIALNQSRNKIRKSIFTDSIKLRKYLLKNKIRVILVIGRTTVLQTILAVLGTNIKVIFCHHHEINIDNYTRQIKEKKKKKLVYLFVKYRANKIVTLTNNDRINYYINGKRIDPQRIINIYNFLDEKLLNKLEKYNAFSKKFITVGRIDFAKGYEYLIEVAKLVFDKYPDWQWHIYGDGETEYKNKIIDLIKGNNLQSHVILMGNRSDIYDLYQKYSFYVMTSRYEGLPMVLLEAKAKKLPIISFDINSGPSDIVRDGVDGYLVIPFDCNTMADKICELIENPELRQKFSDNAHGNIDKFSKEKIMKQWCDLIEEVTK